MPAYREIEDVALLRQLSLELTRRIRRRLKYAMRKVVGYPSGRAEMLVHFGAKEGAATHWWSSERSENGEAYINLLGRGDPESNAYLMIDLQFNVPVKKFGRTHGGAFVEDIESGAFVLAHRGIVSRGKSRVKKDALLRETTARTTTVTTSTGPVELFLVASLDSPELVQDIAAFAQEMRRAADAAMTSVSTRQGKAPLSSHQIDNRLVRYFDEFCGRRRLPRRNAVIVEVRHGRVVQHLKQVLSGVGEPLKSQWVDLAIRARGVVLLFEVKTSVAPSDLYTAVGQLSLHSLAVGEQFPQSRIRKVLVVPSFPAAQVRMRMEESLGIEVLTFRWKSASALEFDAPALSALRI